MRHLRKLAVLLATCLASTGGASGLAVQVQAGDWGTASVRDIETVLLSVADVLAPNFPRHASARVVVGFSKAGPRVLARKSVDGAHQVLLNVQDTRWDQFAYQFSHELCHIFSNYDQRPVGAAREHQWFEETVCEAVSIATLHRLASSWKTAPPHAGWDAYAPAFGEYAERLLSEGHRHLAQDRSIGDWYRGHQAALESDPYLRRENELLATAVLELLESTPGSLEAIGYLNLETPAQESFAAYLASWYSCCPEEQRTFVRRVIALLALA